MARTPVAKPSTTTERPESAVDAELFLSFLRTHKKNFDATLARRLREAQRRYPRAGDSVKFTTDALVALCERGGKRVRPGLLLAGQLCVTANPDMEAVAEAGAALELLHGYFLVHDDWMDGDLTRRGGPSVHAMLRQKLASHERGDAAAIMAGDWGVAVATDWMSRLSVSPKYLASALACFAEMQLAAVTGQIRDLLPVDDSPEVTYQLKTASYTVTGPLQLGASLVGAKPERLLELERFGTPIGVAFQLQDDIIGVFSPAEVTGKPFASDLKQGKRTVLLLEGQKRAGAPERRLMARVIGNPDAKEKDIQQVVLFLGESGARAAVARRIRHLHRKALSALDAAKFRLEGKALLKSAATALVERSA